MSKVIKFFCFFGEADPNSPSMPCCVEGECGECDNPNYLGDPSEGCEGVVCQDCETCARGVCYDDCPLGEMCEDDECVENMIGGCTTDADCGFGGTCVSGACSDGCDDALCNSDCQADGFDGGSCTPDGEFSCTCTGAPDDSDDEGDDVLPPAPDDCEDAECNSDCQMRGYEEGGSCVAEGEGLVCECAGAGPDDSDDTGCTYPCSSDSDCDAFADPEHPSTAACVDGCCEN
ncbi:MAG: hypothetical protein HYR97_01425 [Candidatus Melainabacteria bacterium]|nr:hypothetical protein [Candidatus Melainabacteria bacterium]